MSNPFPTVGVIGAGQLARMMVAPATALGVDLLLFAQSSEDSAAQITNHIVGDYKNVDDLREFAKKCSVITFEHELIPVSVIRILEAEGIVIRPSSDSFIFSQDKAQMRVRLSKFPAPKWKVITSSEGVTEFPLIAKSIVGGYDGRGVWKIDGLNELEQVLAQNGKLLIEELLEFNCEIAVMVARSPHGQASTWAPTQTIQLDGICISTVTPAPDISEDVAVRAQKMALDIAKEIGLVGVMAVEMFVRGEDIYVNELAMRPHNSGHWTIEGARTSQFEQHLRAILDLPLGDTSMNSSFAVMGNILGGTKSDMFRPYLHLMARSPGLKIHQYKKEVRLGRKIGHVTAVGENILDLRESVDHALAYMSGEIDE